MPNIEINLRPAKVLAIVIAVIHLGAMVCVFSVFSIWLQVVLILLIGVNLYYVLWRYILLRSSKSIVKIWHKEDDVWYLMRRSGRLVEKQLRSSFVARFMIILNFKVPVILCEQGKLQNLRVYLKMRG